MSQSRDPIKSQILLFLSRIADFAFLLAVLTSGLWIGCLWFGFRLREIDEMWRCTGAAWDGSNRTCWLVAHLCFGVGFATTVNVFLGAALWWRRTGERHHRGATLIDERR